MALLRHMARIGDSELRAAAELREHLREMTFRAQDKTRTTRVLDYRPAITTIAEALQSRPDAPCGWVFQPLSSSVLVFAVRHGEQVTVALGYGDNPGCWGALFPWRRCKAETREPQVLAWAEEQTYELREYGAESSEPWEVIRVGASVARRLCDADGDLAGDFRFWSAVGEPNPYYDVRPAVTWTDWRRTRDIRAGSAKTPASGNCETFTLPAPSRSVTTKLEQALARIGLEDGQLRRFLQQHVGRPRVDGLTSGEARHVLKVLERAPEPSLAIDRQQQQIQTLCRERGLGARRLTEVLREQAGVQRLRSLPSAAVPRVLRALERLAIETAPSGGPAPSGHPFIVDPLEDLMTDKTNAATRVELGRLWGQRQGNELTRSSDLEPVRVQPEERWSTQLESKSHYNGMIASPLGIACRNKKGVVVLDADSGEFRYEVPPAKGMLIAGDVLLTFARSRVTGYDLWTGDLLYDEKIKGTATTGQYAGGLLVTGGKGGLFGYRLEDPRRAPELAWTYPGEFWPPKNLHTDEDGLYQSSLVTSAYVLAQEIEWEEEPPHRWRAGPLHVVSPAGERVRTLADPDFPTRLISPPRAPGYAQARKRSPKFPDVSVPLADEHGALCVRWRGDSSREGHEAEDHLLEPLTGANFWTRRRDHPPGNHPFALTAHGVVYWEPKERATRALNRATGDPRCQITETAAGKEWGAWDLRNRWVCRDVVYGARNLLNYRSALVGLSSEQGELWCVDLGKSDIKFVRPGQRRVYALVGSRRVVCLEKPGA